MPSAKALYMIDKAEMKDDGNPFMELHFTRVYDPQFNDGAPSELIEQFRDIKRATDLANCGERIACMVTQWQGCTATTMIAKESELPNSVIRRDDHLDSSTAHRYG